MSVSELKQITQQQQGIDKPRTRSITFPDMLDQYKSQIAAALPKHLNPDRMARIALTEFRKNPELGNCDPRTVFASIIIAAQLGLEPGVMGQSYLIPYKGTCTFVPGWQGYVDLVSRSGRGSVWTDAVRKGDKFIYTKGTSPSIHHEPGDDADDDSPFTHVYAVGRIRNAEWPVIEVWSRNKVLKHLNRYNKVGNRHYALQNENNLEMYGRKVALLQVIKYMPKSIELATAANLDYAADAGAQNINVDEAISGTFVANGYQHENNAPTIDGDQQAEQQKGEKKEPDPKVKRMNEIFELLGWNDAAQAKWIKANESLSLDDKIAKLEKMLA